MIHEYNVNGSIEVEREFNSINGTMPKFIELKKVDFFVEHPFLFCLILAQVSFFVLHNIRISSVLLTGQDRVCFPALLFPFISIYAYIIPYVHTNFRQLHSNHHVNWFIELCE